MMTVRALKQKGCVTFVNEERRSRMDGLLGGARNAIEKSCEEDGEEGVTMIAGRGDFSVARGRERSCKRSSNEP